MTLDRAHIEECVLIASAAARRGGAVLLDWRQRFAVRNKGRFDLVTEADHAAQEAIQAFLAARTPDFGFVGEESPRLLNLESGRPTWIVDPLDGTTNYVHDCPQYAVSVGLALGADLLVGAIFDPSRNELFYAGTDVGAWLNGQRLHVSPTATLEEALLSVGFPPDPAAQQPMLAAWAHLSQRTQGLRRTGSTALNLAYVAAGRHDGFWTNQAHPWDAAAGIVLVREAGGQITKLDGAAYDPAKLDILASNGILHSVLIATLRATQAAATQQP